MSKNPKKKRIYLWVISALAVFVVLVFVMLPSILTWMGLHPHYEGRKFDLAGKKALIITTSHGVLGKTGKATGVAASEMTVPYYQFLEAKMQVDVASIKGGKIPIDPMTIKWPIYTDADKRYLKDSIFQRKVRKSLKIDDVDFNQYAIIFLAGGWGASYDLGYSDVLGKKLSVAYQKGAVIGGVCHGPLGLLKVKDKAGKLLLNGLKVTAVTDKQVKELGIQITPLHPETELRKAKANFQSRSAFRDVFATLVVVDKRVVTGQNQNSGAETAQKMMGLLETLLKANKTPPTR